MAIQRPTGRAGSPPSTPKLATPVYIRVSTTADEDALELVLEHFTKALKEESDIVVVNPKCSTKGGRAELRDTLVDFGVPAKAMGAFGWATVGPDSGRGRPAAVAGDTVETEALVV